MVLMHYISEKIRELRQNYNSGEGLSQGKLAELMGVATNTISRWETGNYKPSVEDLEKLSAVFGVSILEFFPKENVPKQEKLYGLFRAAEGLHDDDIEELKRYAEFRKARSFYNQKKRPSQGRRKQ